jgi:hypothetical protein
MFELILIGTLVVVLAMAAQIRRGGIVPPLPVADRVRITVEPAQDAVVVSFAGVPGLVLSFHRASWDHAEVVEVSGPATLVGKGDVRRYRLNADGHADDLRICHVWEQLTLREFEFSVPALVPGTEVTAPTVEGAA